MPPFGCRYAGIKPSKCQTMGRAEHIRPKPEYGTIELRVCDTPFTVEISVALASYLQVLCRYLLDRTEPAPAEDDYLVYNYNRFRACRFGMNVSLVHLYT